MILPKGNTSYTISSGGLPTGIPLYWEIPILHGVATVTTGTYTRIASRAIDLTYFPSTYNALNRDIRLNCIFEVPSGFGDIKLVDITTPGSADINFTYFNTLNSAPTLFTSSSSIPVSTTPGDLFPTNSEIYELQMAVGGGGASVTCSAAWLSISYI